MAAIDRDAMLAFLTQRFGDLEVGERIEIRALDRNRGGAIVGRGFFPTAEDATDYACRLDPALEIYYGINPRMGHDGTKAGVARILVNWADLDHKGFDGDPMLTRKALEAYELGPTWLIDSGGGLQPYWAIEPLDAAAYGPTVERVLRALYARLGNSDRVQNADRIFRLPGTFNNKYGTPRPVRVLLHDPSARYTIKQIEATLPSLPEEERTPPLSAPTQAGEITQEEVCHLLSFIPPTLPYREYLAVWMAVHALYPGDEGMQLVDEWSSEAREAHGQTCSPRTQPGKHRGFRRSGEHGAIGAGTLYWYAQRHGWQRPTPTLERKGAPVTNADQSAVTGGDPCLVITSLADVVSRPIAWLWEGWVARGKVQLLGGHPGDGKSTLAAALAAILSTGGPWPDGTTAPTGNTLFLLAEDALDDTLRPRLDRHGADTGRVFAVEAVRDKEGKDRAFSLADHLALLEQQINERGIVLVVIDPLTSFMPRSDRNSEGDVRDLLTPLGKLAERTGAAILCIMHVGKPTGTNRRPVQQLLGATAFGAVARTVMMVAPVSAEQTETRRVLGVVKSNLAMRPPALEWSLPGVDRPIAWHGPTQRDLGDLLSGSRTSKLEQAEEAIRDILKSGPLPSKELQDRCVERGIADATRRRAEKEIGTETWKEAKQDGPHWVGLPNQRGGWFAASRRDRP